MKITDKDRLDFIQNNHCAVYERFGLQDHHERWITEFKLSSEYFKGKSVREAIDNAIMAMREEGK